MNKSENIKKQADIFLHKMGLLNKLREYGEPHIIGSYRMDIMAWNDLDIDIVNTYMSIEKLYELSHFVIETFKPIWYEAKQETNQEGKVVWFHGFETMITGELWNVDLWFFDEETILKAEQYCTKISDKIKKNPDLIETITSIKEGLINKWQYGYGQYTSKDVYNAVLDHNVKTLNEFYSFVK
ncbi:MAG: hypothetical protein FWG45_06980 [Oscillospiraceae bacterium]|nr:hypothetical protein [Oscillospiraceae bacterium]